MSKYMGLREEHMDLFGSVSSGAYTSGITLSGTSEITTTNVVQKMCDIALWRVKVFTKTGEASGTVAIKVKGANALSAGALSNATEVMSISGVSVATSGAVILDTVIPNGYKYYQVTLTPNASAAGAVIEGWIEPEFN